MAHLTYGLSQGGCFIVLTGEVGTGKTTLCRNLLGDLPDDVDVALILNANINEQELLQTVCDELKIAYQMADSQKQLLDKINTHLLASFADNRQTVLIIDEAQLLSRDVLEQIRLLTNLETTKSKLLQIILIGQPELNDLLSRNDLRQLAQRVTARYHLGALQRGEIEDYVNFRLAVAGCRKPIFTRQALNQLHRSTDGIPRRINVLADHALLSAYSKNDAVVDAKSVKAATKEVFIQSRKSNIGVAIWFKWGGALGVLVLINMLLWWWFATPSYQHSNQTPIVSSSSLARESLGPIADTSVQGSKSVVAEKPLSPSVAATNGLTTIIRSGDIAPGSVVIAEQPLDASELIAQQPESIIQPPVRVFSYDAGSELGQALDASADLTGRIAAFRALAAAWDVDLPGQLIQPACDTLKESGIDCLGVTSWAQLQRYNRPTILVLDQNDSLHRVIVFKLEQDLAQVLVGRNVVNVSTSELQSRWTNNGITFWRPSSAGGEFLQQGDTSNRLPELRAVIDQALLKLNMPALENLTSANFDLSLAQVIFALQARYSLLADSKIGSETYLLLNEILLAEQTPVLRQRVQ
ncbi:MAG: general secretion pathway protein A [Arenicella sp.]|jgi:general secretion pathway protein A